MASHYLSFVVLSKPMHKVPSNLRQFDSLVEIVRALRSPGGCPWDREQTHQSLTPYAIEEVYELVEAIESGSTSGLREELGDLLLQVLLHAQIASENGHFVIEDVIETL